MKLIKDIENRISFDSYLKFVNIFSWFNLIGSSYSESNYKYFWKNLTNDILSKGHNEPWRDIEAYLHYNTQKTIQEFLVWRTTRVGKVLISLYFKENR